eukprot:PhF_6_TR37482/c0_g2_i1/m.55253
MTYTIPPMTSAAGTTTFLEMVLSRKGNHTVTCNVEGDEIESTMNSLIGYCSSERPSPSQSVPPSNVSLQHSSHSNNMLVGVKGNVVGALGVPVMQANGGTQAFQQSFFRSLSNKAGGGVHYLELPFILHPTQLKLSLGGQDPLDDETEFLMSWYMGCIVGNLIIIVSVMVIHYGISVIHQLYHHHRSSSDIDLNSDSCWSHAFSVEGMSRVRFPHYSLYVEGHFRAVMLSCSVTLMAYSHTTWIRVSSGVFHVVYVLIVIRLQK